MRLSEFWRAVDDEFGEAYGRVLVRDLILDTIGYRTGEQALADGESAGSVWLALCRAMEIPKERWAGRGRPAPKK